MVVIGSEVLPLMWETLKASTIETLTAVNGHVCSCNQRHIKQMIRQYQYPYLHTPTDSFLQFKKCHLCCY